MDSSPGSNDHISKNATQANADTQLGDRLDASEANMFPGLRILDGPSTYGVDEIKDVIDLLSAANIPACVVDVNALRYYGAGRVTWEWDVCVPTNQLEDAESIFKNNPNYEAAKPPPPLINSFRHLNSTFKLKNMGFFFILTPSSQCFIDPHPEHYEFSKNGIPYPKMVEFAQSLLVLQDGSKLDDFIDGMNLDKKWGEDNLDFDTLQVKGVEFTKAKNIEFAERNLGEYNINIDYRKRWNESVDTKARRIEPMKRGRYKTRWRRIKNDVDPRIRDRPV